MRSEGHRTGRPPNLLPPPDWLPDPYGGPLALPILQEVDGTTGLALWITLRRVHLWVVTPAHRKSRLRIVRQKGPTGLVDALRDTDELATFADLAARLASAPNRVSAASILLGCEDVIRWAENQRLWTTAFYFAEAAARLDADDPTLSQIAGRLSRKARMFDRSTSWLTIAYRMAVTQRKPDVAIEALKSSAVLAKELGRVDEARSTYERISRYALRTGRKRQAAEVQHDLLAIAAEQCVLPDAIQHAWRALELYPLHHARLPYLAHDFAFACLRAGWYARAHTILSRFMQLVAHERLLPGLSTYAWSLAGLGERDRFDKAAKRVVAVVSGFPDYVAAAHIHLAEGTRLLGDWSEAAKHARTALDFAKSRDQGGLVREATALERDILDRLRPRTPSAAPDDDSAALIRHFSARLRRWKAASPTSPEIRAANTDASINRQAG